MESVPRQGASLRAVGDQPCHPRMDGRVNRTILVALGVILLAAGLGVSYAQWSSGAQPWGQLLGDNFLFARTLPFTIGLGIVVGYWKASGAIPGTQRRTKDGAIRRFGASTVWLRCLAGVAVVRWIRHGG